MPNEDQIKKVQLFESDEIDEIIGQPPPWLIRWGISVFLFVLILIITLSILINYPEVIAIQFNLKSTNSSQSVIMTKDGKVNKLLVSEGSYVHKNDTLISFENNQINDKSKSCIITSSTDGKVNFISGLQENQLLLKGQILFYITPSVTSYFAVLNASQKQVVRIKCGQMVNIKLSAYPFQEYGSINGIVSYVSDLATESGYYVKVSLPNGLKTTYGKILSYKENLTGTANIIIKKRRFIEKIMEVK